MRYKRVSNRATVLLQALYQQQRLCFSIQQAQYIYTDLFKNVLEKLLSNIA
ncbi:MAG: hypothetical protein AAFU83_00685 [Bacteroidota bacterium]